jgi:uncharacterized membrane protein (DUF4010 family)
MEASEALTSLGVSLGLGLLVGLQRERHGSRLAGVRTFPLITLLGTTCALVGGEIGGSGWVVGAGLLAVVTAMTAANFMELYQRKQRGTGMTTEAAILLMYMLGAYTAVGEHWVALTVGTAVALLLYLKADLHGLIARIGDKDMRAIMLFAALTFIVLPVLPNRPMGPLDVWNPRGIWLVVVLVVGISLGGYVAYKVLGSRGGTLAAGILGGLLSSTATTVSYSRRARENASYAGPAMLVINIATFIVYARVLIEIAAFGPNLIPLAAAPIALMGAAAAVGVGIGWIMEPKNGNGLPAPENPTQLKSALVFAGILALVLLAVEAGRRWLGTGGVFAVSGLAGLVNLDAITLSNARLAQAGRLDPHAAWRAIVVALLANLLFKLVVAGVIGGRPLLVRLGGCFALQAVVGLGVLFW